MNDLMTKSFTSYVDLKKATMKDLEAGVVDVEMAETNMDSNLAVFLEDAEKVKKEMSCIQEILITLEQANEESKSLHKPEALKAHRQRINTDIVTVLKKARAIKAQLTDMDESNAAISRLSDWKEGNAVYRTRTSVTNGLRKKLKQLMMDFQNLRQKMMSEFRETIGRRYFTVTGELPNEEEIEKIVSSSHGEEFLRKAIQQHGRGGVAETVVEIQDRHDAAKEVEKSLLELHQVFLDMAVMVEAQGEQMDNIEHHVMTAEHYVRDGGKNLATAKRLQKRSRKWMCIAVIVLLVLILVVVIPIAASFDSS